MRHFFPHLDAILHGISTVRMTTIEPQGVAGRALGSMDDHGAIRPQGWGLPTCFRATLRSEATGSVSPDDPAHATPDRHDARGSAHIPVHRRHPGAEAPLTEGIASCFVRDGDRSRFFPQYFSV